VLVKIKGRYEDIFWVNPAHVVTVEEHSEGAKFSIAVLIDGCEIECEMPVADLDAKLGGVQA